MEENIIAQKTGDPIVENVWRKIKKYYEKLWGMDIFAVNSSPLMSFEDFDNWEDTRKVCSMYTERDPRDEDFKTDTKKLSDKLFITHLSKEEIKHALDSI